MRKRRALSGMTRRKRSSCKQKINAMTRPSKKRGKDPDPVAHDNPKGSNPDINKAGEFAMYVESVLEETN